MGGSTLGGSGGSTLGGSGGSGGSSGPTTLADEYATPLVVRALWSSRDGTMDRNEHGGFLASIPPQTAPLALNDPAALTRWDAWVRATVAVTELTRHLAYDTVGADGYTVIYRDATVVAYVPRAEGWGLPPVEALAQGSRVVASVTTPSVIENDEVVLVDPLDVDAIARGLLAAVAAPDDEPARARRRASVADLTWRNVALDHLAGWR